MVPVDSAPPRPSESLRAKVNPLYALSKAQLFTRVFAGRYDNRRLCVACVLLLLAGRANTFHREGGRIYAVFLG